MRIFIDTNIVIDYLTNRVEESPDAERLFQLSNFANVELVITDLTIVNIAYICRKVFSLNTIYDKLKLLSDIVTIIPIGERAIRLAIEARTKDFEDAVQYYAARDYSCDFLITRNSKDYIYSSIPVLTAKQIVERLVKF